MKCTAGSSIVRLWKALAFVAAILVASQTWASSPAYPTKPIHIIVPSLAGGSIDVLARIVASKLHAAWGQPVIVENRAGAGEDIGANIVAKAAPDGYTVMLSSPSPLGINWFLYKHMPFNPRTAFTPVSVLGEMPNLLVVGPALPAMNIHGFLAYAKAHPGKLTFGSPGVGTTPHLAGVLLGMKAGINIVHVPYKGFPPSLEDLMASRIDFMFANTTNILPVLKKGEGIRVLATGGRKRFPGLPNIPTLIQAGVPGFVSTVWMSFAGPAHMPMAIVQKWHTALQKIIKMPDVKARFAALGFIPWASTSEQMRQKMNASMKRWGPVIKHAGIRR